MTSTAPARGRRDEPPGAPRHHWRPLPTGVRPWVFGFAWRFLTCVVPYYGYRVEGHENLPLDGPVLLVLNHLDDVDPPFIAVASRPRTALQMAAARHFESRWLSWIMSSVGAFPVRTDRPDGLALRHARDLLADGRLVVIYPEGRPSYSSRLGPFEEGVGLLAVTPGITVVPAAIWGTHRVRRHNLPLGRGPVTVRYGRPLAVPQEGPRRERAARVTAELRDAVQALVDELAAAEARG